MTQTPDLEAFFATLEQLPPHGGVVFRGCEARSHERWAGRAHVTETLLSTSRDPRVDEQTAQARVCSAEGGKLGRADADFVKARTGFAIGGVSPVAHATPPVALIDAQLFRFDEIWAAAGHPHAVFRLSPAQLQALSGAPVHDVTTEAVAP